MWAEEPGPDLLFYQNKCFSINCMVNNDFPRYICVTDRAGSVCWQEYAAGHFYAKVSDTGTKIYKLVSCMLTEDIHVPETLWLNPINFEATLDRVQGLHYILWNG
jgi:hypothetical protein